MVDNPVSDFIDTRRWRYATTMPDWPHEYTVRDWAPEDEASFLWFCQIIDHNGVEQPWPDPPAVPIYHNKYLVIGVHQYWAMGPLGDADPVPDKTIINRALAPPPSEGPVHPAAGSAELGSPR